MQGKIVGLAFLLSLTIVSGADVDEKDVVVLTPQNFDQVIQQNKNVLVEFYAPWCGHCKQLTPHYAKAATALKSAVPEVVIAKVDADKHKDLGEKFKVKGFPTLKWFTNGEASDYSGGRTEETIVSWIKKRMGPATQSLKSNEEHDNFVASADVVVVSYFENTKSDNKHWSAVSACALEVDGVAFANADVKSIHEHAGYKDGDIVLYKKMEGGHKVAFEGTPTASQLKNWIGVHQLPFVNDFSPETAPKIFGSPIKNQFLLFADKSSSEYGSMRSQLEIAAKEYHGKAIAVYVSPEHKQVTEYFGVTSDMIPCVFAVSMPEEGSRGQMKRFEGPRGAAVGESGVINEFVGNVLSGKVLPHRKSEAAPANSEDGNGVTTLVGSTFESIVLDETKDVLVEFYAPWCGHCKQLAPIYDKLGKAFKDTTSVVIAKMDATVNDPPEGTDVQGFPTIKFYRAGKNKTPVDYDGERTLKAMRKFIRKNAGVPLPAPRKASKSEL